MVVGDDRYEPATTVVAEVGTQQGEDQLMISTVTLAAMQFAPGHTWGHGGGWWWLPFTFIFWIGVAVAVRYLIFHARGARPQAQSGIERARDILAERLARGEIPPEEYDERMSYLS
jgi:putative membrane protein